MVSWTDFSLTLSSKYVEVEPPYMWKQYSIQGRNNLLYVRSNRSGEKTPASEHEPQFITGRLNYMCNVDFNDKHYFFVLSDGILKPSREMGKLD